MWYYLLEGQQQGPVADAAFHQLIANGIVSSETFVWKEGLAEWLPFGQVPHEPGAVIQPVQPAARQVPGRHVVVSENAWRAGRRVVTYNHETLPPRCYKCNCPVEEAPLERKFHWHPWPYYLILPVGLLFYIIAAMIVSKRATVDIYLCRRHRVRRGWFMATGWAGVALGIATVITGLAAHIEALVVSGFFIIVLATFVGLSGSSIARAMRIKGDAVWLNGAGRDYLASLTNWK